MSPCSQEKEFSCVIFAGMTKENLPHIGSPPPTLSSAKWALISQSTRLAQRGKSDLKRPYIVTTFDHAHLDLSHPLAPVLPNQPVGQKQQADSL